MTEIMNLIYLIIFIMTLLEYIIFFIYIAIHYKKTNKKLENDIIALQKKLEVIKK